MRCRLVEAFFGADAEQKGWEDLDHALLSDDGGEAARDACYRTPIHPVTGSGCVRPPEWWALK